ncbi:MAG: response regulator transcription factor, partial [Dehalococcoidia bacterium]
MRNLLIIGDENMAAYAEAMEAEGYSVCLRPPGASEPIKDSLDAVVLDLTTVVEDTGTKRFLEEARGEDSPALIAIIGPDQMAAFDPTRNLDDFLLTGATPRELAARVRQALWKRSRVDTKNILKCGDLVIDLANYTVHVAGRPVEITYKEYELLRFLATNRDRVFNRDTLLNKVWGYDFYGGARTVDV